MRQPFYYTHVFIPLGFARLLVKGGRIRGGSQWRGVQLQRGWRIVAEWPRSPAGHAQRRATASH